MTESERVRLAGRQILAMGSTGAAKQAQQCALAKLPQDLIAPVRQYVRQQWRTQEHYRLIAEGQITFGKVGKEEKDW